MMIVAIVAAPLVFLIRPARTTAPAAEGHAAVME